MSTVKAIIKKLLLLTGILVLLYLALLFITERYITLHKDLVLADINGLLKDNLAGNASIKDVDVSVWRSFPLISVTATGFALSDSVRHLPVLSLDAVSSSFNIFQLIFRRRTIQNVKIQHGVLHISTDSTGYKDSYVLALKNQLPATPGKKSSSQVNINNFSVSNLEVRIENTVKEKEISFTINSLTAAISQSDSLLNIILFEKVNMKKGLGFNLRKGAYLENQAVNGEWKLQFDSRKKQLAFEGSRVTIGQQPFDLSGHFVFDKQSPSFDLAIHTKQLTYDLAKAMLTTAIREKLNRYNIKDFDEVKGTIAGSLLAGREPAVNLECTSRDNTVKSNFADFTHCYFKGTFTNTANTNAPAADSN